MKSKILYLLAIVLLALVCGLLSIFWLGRALGGWTWILAAILGGAAAVGLALAFRRLSPRVWSAAELLTLAGLVILPTSLLVETEKTVLGGLPQPFLSLLILIIFLMPLLALYLAAVLFQAGLSGSKHRWAAAAFIILGALLVGMVLYQFYWLIVWDNTSDGLEFFWLGPPVLVAVYCGALLSINLRGWAKLAGGIYALLIPALLIVVYTNAHRVDFRQLTNARAERVSQAVEAYYARNGHYPENLSQLVPRYLLALPGPVIINGQEWCFDGGDSYYRLGYVDRPHWSAPILNGQTYVMKGAAPDLPPICGKEIAALHKRFPGYYRAEGE